MKVVVLSSSSKGNSTYIEMNNSKFLIDAGLGFNDIKEKSMAEKNASPEIGPAPSAVTDLTPEEQEIIRQHREKRKQAGA